MPWQEIILVLCALTVKCDFSSRNSLGCVSSYTFEEGQFDLTLNSTSSHIPGCNSSLGPLTFRRTVANWLSTPNLVQQGVQNAFLTGGGACGLYSPLPLSATGIPPNNPNTVQMTNVTFEWWVNLGNSNTGTLLGLTNTPLSASASTFRVDGSTSLGTSQGTYRNIASGTAVIEVGSVPDQLIYTAFSFFPGVGTNIQTTRAISISTSGTILLDEVLSATNLWDLTLTGALGQILCLFVDSGSTPGASLLMVAVYNRSLSTADYIQNALAGPPPSRPYSTTNSFSGPPGVLFAIPLISFCECVTPGAMNASVLSIPTAGTLSALNDTDCTAQIIVPSVPYVLSCNGVVYFQSSQSGRDLTNFTYECIRGSAISAPVFMSISINAPQFLWSGIENSYVTIRLNVSVGTGPQTLVITSFPAPASLLFQYSGGCPGNSLNASFPNITDPIHRLCLFLLPSGAFPVDSPLPPDSGSGQTIVSTVNFTFVTQDSFGFRSAPFPVQSEAFNHLTAEDFSTSGFRNVSIDLTIASSSTLSIPFGIFFDTIPSVGNIFANNVPVLADTLYDSGSNFTYELMIQDPGTVTATFHVQENDTRAWSSIEHTITIVNLPTPIQPTLNLSLSVTAYTCNPIDFPIMIIAPDESIFPDTRVLHVTFSAGSSISFSLCFDTEPNAAMQQIQRQLNQHGDFDSRIKFDSGSCGSASLEISATLFQLRQLLATTVITGNSFVNSNLDVAACLYVPSISTVTCDHALLDITFYSVAVDVVQTTHCAGSPNYSFWGLMPPGQWFIIFFIMAIICVPIILCPLVCCHCCTMCFCETCCCYTKRPCCNECVEPPEEIDLQLAKLEKDNRQLTKENERLNRELSKTRAH